MIQQQSYVNVTDNSGAKVAMVIKVLGGTRRRFATLGDTVVLTIKKAIPNSNVAKGTVVKGIVVRTRKENLRKDGSYIKFDDNAVVILNAAGEPKATRILGPIAREVRGKGPAKIMSLAPEVL